MNICGIDLKKSKPSSTVISRISWIFLSLNLISRVSSLNLFPLHISHSTYKSGRKCISTFTQPSPLQFSHLPPSTLKLNLPGLYPLALDSAVLAKISLIWVNKPVYVAGLDLGVLPIGLWSIEISLSIFSSPRIFLNSVFSGIFELFNFEFTPGINVWLIKDDFPEPDTPVIATNLFKGISIFTSLRLLVFAPEI